MSSNPTADGPRQIPLQRRTPGQSRRFRAVAGRRRGWSQSTAMVRRQPLDCSRVRKRLRARPAPRRSRRLQSKWSVGEWNATYPLRSRACATAGWNPSRRLVARERRRQSARSTLDFAPSFEACPGRAPETSRSSPNSAARAQQQACHLAARRWRGLPANARPRLLQAGRWRPSVSGR